MRKKQQTTEHEDSPDHIISRTCSTSASREQLNSPRCWVEPFGSFFGGYLFSVWVACVHFILFIKLFLSVYCLNLCRATFGCESLNERHSCLSYFMMKSLMLCIK